MNVLLDTPNVTDWFQGWSAVGQLILAIFTLFLVFYTFKFQIKTFQKQAEATEHQAKATEAQKDLLKLELERERRRLTPHFRVEETKEVFEKGKIIYLVLYKNDALNVRIDFIQYHGLHIDGHPLPSSKYEWFEGEKEKLWLVDSVDYFHTGRAIHLASIRFFDSTGANEYSQRVYCSGLLNFNFEVSYPELISPGLE
jgi:hypothetical protein